MSLPTVRPGVPVPYITGYENEPVLRPPRVRRTGPKGSFLGYGGETRYDRDTWGTLWVRQAIAPKARRGRARLEEVHALRQRKAMLDMLCQVCGRPTVDGRGEERHLFLMRDAGRPIGEGETTTSPPVCVPCARTSVEACPHLRRGYVAAWVGFAPAWGAGGGPGSSITRSHSNRPTGNRG